MHAVEYHCRSVTLWRLRLRSVLMRLGSANGRPASRPLFCCAPVCRPACGLHQIAMLLANCGQSRLARERIGQGRCVKYGEQQIGL
jgi:hypothetical protein